MGGRLSGMQVLDAKTQRSTRQHQSAGQKSSGNSNSNRENKNTSSNFIPWDASVTELVTNATTVMKSEHIWGLDSHANVHITPYLPFGLPLVLLHRHCVY